ncbi:MAG TPA: glycosyltransferase family 39 protein [Candidatus Binatia bacterium]|nr:glycosyltransferase family 39 protein [Candidatus Binatia bacterium]
MKNRFLRDVLLVAVVGAAALLPFLGQTHAVSSHEIRHAEISREMAQSGNFLIPTLLGHPYRDKPPVLSAAIALLFRWHGEPSIALARLPCAVAGIAGAIVLYGLGRTLTERHAALLAALGVLGVQGYQNMARTARPDMIFTLAILAAALFSVRALARPRAPRARAGFAVAGAACAVASLLKGPLAWAFCALFPYLAWLCATGLRRPGIRDWFAFAVGFVAAAAVWLIPVLLLDRGAYLVSFLTQPDLTTWHLLDTFRRIHWPWMYGLVGLLPLGLFLPAVAVDARRRGLTAPLAIALAMLVVLSLIPKKRMHYQLPVYPFLALAVVDALVRSTGRRSLERAARTLVALSLVAGPLYLGVLLPRLRPGEDPDVAAARKILALTVPAEPIIAVGEFAETIAFVGRRTDVLERAAGGDIVDAIRTAATSALIVVARSEESVLDPVRALFPLEEVGRVEGDHRTWLAYRARGAGVPLGRADS